MIFFHPRIVNIAAGVGVFAVPFNAMGGTAPPVVSADGDLIILTRRRRDED